MKHKKLKTLTLVFTLMITSLTTTACSSENWQAECASFLSQTAGGLDGRPLSATQIEAQFKQASGTLADVLEQSCVLGLDSMRANCKVYRSAGLSDEDIINTLSEQSEASDDPAFAITTKTTWRNLVNEFC